MRRLLPVLLVLVFAVTACVSVPPRPAAEKRQRRRSGTGGSRADSRSHKGSSDGPCADRQSRPLATAVTTTKAASTATVDPKERLPLDP